MSAKRYLSMFGAASLVLAGSVSVVGLGNEVAGNGVAFGGYKATQEMSVPTAILASTVEGEIESPDGDYSMELDMNEGLVLDLNSGDEVILSSNGDSAEWVDEDGEVIATITIETSDGADIEFDPETGALAPENLQESASTVLCSAKQGVATAGCGKLAKAVWTISWTGLVCGPLTAGTAGLTKHVGAVVAVGKGCYKTGKWIYKKAC